MADAAGPVVGDQEREGLLVGRVELAGQAGPEAVQGQLGVAAGGRRERRVEPDRELALGRDREPGRGQPEVPVRAEFRDLFGVAGGQGVVDAVFEAAVAGQEPR